MKKICSIILLLFLAGCGKTIELQRSVHVAGFDFSKYSDMGFLFTPQSYTLDYKSIGVLSATVFPAVKKIVEGESYNISGYEKIGKDEEWLAEKLNPSDAIDEMYNAAVKMGADAIVNFNIKWVTKMNGLIELKGFEVSGFAIKRKPIDVNISK